MTKQDEGILEMINDVKLVTLVILSGKSSFEIYKSLANELNNPIYTKNEKEKMQKNLLKSYDDAVIISNDESKSKRPMAKTYKLGIEGCKPIRNEISKLKIK